MKIKTDYMMREVAGNFVVVPTGAATLDFNGIITLNHTGAFLWKQLSNSKSEKELVDALREEYEIDTKTAAQDITEFVATLKAADLFE